MAIRTRPTRREVLVGIASGAALVVAWPTRFAAATDAPATRPGHPWTNSWTCLGCSPMTWPTSAMQVGRSAPSRVGPRRAAALVQATVRAGNPPDTFNDVLRLRRAQRSVERGDGAADPRPTGTPGWSATAPRTTWSARLDRRSGFAVPASTKIGFPKWEERP